MSKKSSVPQLSSTTTLVDHAEGTSSVDLGRPVFLEGEDEAAYDRLLAQVTDAVRPTDIIEQFWVQDVVDLMWETLRLRRLKASLLTASAAKGLEAVLNPLLDFGQVRQLAARWYAREEGALKKVDQLLSKSGLTMSHVMAQTLANKLDDVERIDRMIASAEARRHLVIREVERHRAAVASRLRDAAEEIEDADFDDVPAEHPPGSAIA